MNVVSVVLGKGHDRMKRGIMLVKLTFNHTVMITPSVHKCPAQWHFHTCMREKGHICSVDLFTPTGIPSLRGAIPAVHVHSLTGVNPQWDYR